MCFQAYRTEEPFQWFFRKPVPVEKKKKSTSARVGPHPANSHPCRSKTPSSQFPPLSLHAPLPGPRWEVRVDSKDRRKELGGSAGTN